MSQTGGGSAAGSPGQTVPTGTGDPPFDLRLGRWQDVLADVECDALNAATPHPVDVVAGVLALVWLVWAVAQVVTSC